MPEYYAHILNWGPIEAESPEDAAKEIHDDLNNSWSGVHPNYIVTEQETSLDLAHPVHLTFNINHWEFDSGEWYDQDEEWYDQDEGPSQYHTANCNCCLCDTVRAMEEINEKEKDSSPSGTRD